MVMKRKRSISEFSSSPTRPSSSCFTSPSGSINFTFSHAGPSSPSPMPTMDTTPLHLHSRTLKRFRDSRPSEQQVHQRTLGLLYSAQRQQQLPFAQSPPSAVFPDAHATPIPQEANHAVVHASSNGTQRSLHNFWALPSAPAPSVASPLSTTTLVSSAACDDCGIDLPVSDDMGLMEVDGPSLAAADYACTPCSRKVCSHCSVTNLEGQRTCLHCSGRKTWNGNLSWPTGSGMAMC